MGDAPVFAASPDLSECERLEGATTPPPFAIMVFAQGAMPTIAGTSFTVATVPGETYALVAVGHAGMRQGLHVAFDAAELRHTAAGLLRAANHLDGGKGRQ